MHHGRFHLVSEWVHVRSKAAMDDFVGSKVLLGTEGFRLVDQARHGPEDLVEAGHWRAVKEKAMVLSFDCR